MSFKELENHISNFPDFPKKGIEFKDIMPILSNPRIFKDLIERMSSQNIFNEAEAIIGIDARGFIFASAIGFKLSKPIVLARKPGKLPGNLITEKYSLEYGENSLSVQESAISKFDSFVIVDDLLATGGTVQSVNNILKSKSKKISGLSVVVELLDLKGSSKFDFETFSQVSF